MAQPLFDAIDEIDAAMVPSGDGCRMSVAPLTRREAQALDKRVRSVSDKFTNTAATLLELLTQAEHGRIDVALDAPWTVWLKDAVRVDVSDRGERAKLVKLLNGRTYRLDGEAVSPP